MPFGFSAVYESLTNMYSAMPPIGIIPPVATTLSPTWKPPTPPGPTFSTTPATSMPGMKGKEGGLRTMLSRPLSMWMSPAAREQAWTLMSNWPWHGSLGRGHASLRVTDSFGSLPHSDTRAHRMVPISRARAAG
jgi:hypothetical protein